MNGYTHHALLPLGKDETPYRLLTTNFVSTVELENHDIFEIEAVGPKTLTSQVTFYAFNLLHSNNLYHFRKILDDPEASASDRFFALDIAHAKLKERLDASEGLPQYFKGQCIYYTGPSKTPQSHVSGSFSRPPLGRTDKYAEEFWAAVSSMIILATGNR